MGFYKEYSKISNLGIREVEYFNRGKRSIVLKGKLNGKDVAIKLERMGIGAKDRILNEVKFLKILNRYKIGPKLIHSTKNFFVYNLIKGKLIINYVKHAKASLVKNIIKHVLMQCYVIDKLGINKEEMHNPYKHIIVNKNRAYLIDFERCYYTKKPKNVTQFCQFLMSGKLKNILKDKGISVDRDKLTVLLKKYKAGPDNSKFKVLLKTLRI